MEMISEWLLLFKYLFLGLVQGFTEPLPISSSGHLVILREVFGVNIEGLSFEIVVNFGSLIAVLLVYQKDIIRLTYNAFGYLVARKPEDKSDFQFITYLLLATFITGSLGLLFEDQISNRLSAAIIVGFMLLITAAALWIIRNLRGKRSDKDITVKDAIIIGLAQSVAFIPGISRSGATIVAAMLLDMKQETALRFSFLLFIPVSIGVTILSINDIINDPQFDSLSTLYLLAFMASIVATYYSLKWFMHIMKKGKLKYFSLYCLVVGILVILFI